MRQCPPSPEPGARPGVPAPVLRLDRVAILVIAGLSAAITLLNVHFIAVPYADSRFESRELIVRKEALSPDRYRILLPWLVHGIASGAAEAGLSSYRAATARLNVLIHCGWSCRRVHCLLPVYAQLVHSGVSACGNSVSLRPCAVHLHVHLLPAVGLTGAGRLYCRHLAGSSGPALDVSVPGYCRLVSPGNSTLPAMLVFSRALGGGASSASDALGWIMRSCFGGGVSGPQVRSAAGSACGSKYLSGSSSSPAQIQFHAHHATGGIRGVL